MSLLECLKTVPEEIFVTTDYQLKWLRGLFISDHFSRLSANLLGTFLKQPTDIF